MYRFFSSSYPGNDQTEIRRTRISCHVLYCTEFPELLVAHFEIGVVPEKKIDVGFSKKGCLDFLINLSPKELSEYPMFNLKHKDNKDNGKDSNI
jgi:hypothetical protein